VSKSSVLLEPTPVAENKFDQILNWILKDYQM